MSIVLCHVSEVLYTVDILAHCVIGSRLRSYCRWTFNPAVLTKVSSSSTAAAGSGSGAGLGAMPGAGPLGAAGPGGEAASPATTQFAVGGPRTDLLRCGEDQSATERTWGMG